MSRNDLAKAFVVAALAGAMSPATGLAQGKSVNPPGNPRALSVRNAKGPAKPSPSNRGGRGFEQRVLHSMRNFDGHVSCDPPMRPHSP
jgi:hypothetical protein